MITLFIRAKTVFLAASLMLPSVGSLVVAGGLQDGDRITRSHDRIDRSMKHASGSAYGAGGMMYLERTNAEYIADSHSLSSGLINEPFSMVAWVRRDTLDGTFRQCCRVEDHQGQSAFFFRLGGGGNNAVQARMPTAESNNLINGSFSTATTDRWMLVVLTYDPVTAILSRYAVCRNDVGALETLSGSTAVVGEVRNPAVMKLLGTQSPGTSSWQGGKVGCVSIRPGKLFTLTDAVAMFESRHGLAPRTYQDPFLDEVNAIGWNVGLCQNPRNGGVTPVNGARIGSEIINGNYLIQSNGENMHHARPVTVSGSPIYLRDEEFFEPDVVDRPLAMNGQSDRMLEWGHNEPKGIARLAVCGRSRVTRGAWSTPVGNQGHVPYGYSQNWFNGFALHFPDKLGGVLGMRVDGTGRQPGFDHQTGSFWTSGSTTKSQNTDLAREWLNSNQIHGPSRGVILGNDGEISIKYRHLDGTLIDKSQPMQVGVTYLRCPGCADVTYQLVEGDSIEMRGEFVGAAQQTNDANTTEFTHIYDAASDLYSQFTNTLTLNQLSDVLQIGWRVSIVSGAGFRSMAEIVDINGNALTLRHPFSDPPADGSVLAFGPVEYNMLGGDNPASIHDWRGVWIKHDGELVDDEIGAVLLAAHCWREDVVSWHWAMVGWGGNNFVSMLNTLNSDVVGRMMNHMDIDVALLIEGYGGLSIGAMQTQFEAFAEACEEGTDLEVNYLVGNSNRADDLLEKNFHTWAIDMQTDRTAVSVVGSPLIGRWVQQFSYSGRGDSSHGAIEAYARSVRALQELLAPADEIVGDLNGDGVVDVEDVFILLGNWGDCPDAGDCPADLNGDNTVDADDLFILLGNWG